MLFLMALPVILLVIRHKPEDLGLLPDDGQPADAHPDGMGGPAYVSQAPLEGFTLKEALRTPGFLAGLPGYLLHS